MRRESEQSVATRRRLEQLGHDLVAAGLRTPVEPVEEEGPGPAVVIQLPGRHARPEQPSRFPAFDHAHLAVVAVAIAIALAVTAWLVLRSAPQAVTVPVAHTSRASPTGSPSASTDLSSAAAAPTAETTVVVDVAGRVRRPGIVRLPVGSRVIDAVRRAGGARPGADLSGLNLARPLTDGEQILVGRPAATAPTGGSTATAPGGKVSLNSATLEQLDTLPGVGPVTAQKILDWRTQHGRFSSVSELLEVDGIGDKTLADITPRVTL